MVNFTFFAIPIAAPSIIRYFSVYNGYISNLFLSAIISASAVFLFSGWMIDKFGIKAIIISGSIILGAGFLLCAIADSYNMLVVFRVVQGAGVAMLESASLTSMSMPVFKNKAGTIQRINSIAVAIGMIVGSLSAGFVCQFYSWRMIFLMPLPLLFAVILCALRLDKNNSGPASVSDRCRMDILGAVMAFSWLSMILLALNGWKGIMLGSSIDVIFLAVGILIFLLWVRYEFGNPFPMLNLKTICKNINFRSLFLILIARTTVYTGMTFLIPLYLEQIKGRSPVFVGWAMFLFPVAILFLSIPSGFIVDRLNLRRQIKISLIVISIAAAIFGYMVGWDSKWPIMVFVFMLGAGSGIFFPCLFAWLMNTDSGVNKSSISGLYNVSRLLGRGLGICIFEMIYYGFKSTIFGCSFAFIFSAIALFLIALIPLGEKVDSQVRVG